MNYLKNYYLNKFILISRFNYKNISEIPQLEKISLSLRVRSSDFNLLISSMMALEVLTNQRSCLVRSKKQHISLKVSKGVPLGAKVTLRKKHLWIFMSKIQKYVSYARVNVGSCAFQVDNLMLFKEIEVNYHFFRKLDSLSVVINSSARTYPETLILLNFLKNCKNNLTVEYNLAKVNVRVQFSFFAMRRISD